MDFLPGELRVVRRDGIRLFNIHHWDNVLIPMSARSKRRSMVKYDPRNLSRVGTGIGREHHYSVEHSLY
jgi:putative transposase